MNKNASFLPDDYLDQKAERRTNLISLVLFVIVMLGVFLAFLFTNQKYAMVKRDQSAINANYQAAAEQIRELVELEEQKSQMLQKAELAAALVERVPRSVLLAEIINRMPERLSLLEFTLKSERIKPPRPKTPDQGRLKPSRAKTRKNAAAKTERQRTRPPRYSVTISLVGVAPSGHEVSGFLAELNDYELLRSVMLEYLEEKIVETQVMQQFQINAKLNPGADVRAVDPLLMPRGNRDPMSDEFYLDSPRVGRSAGNTARTLGTDGD